MPASLIFIIGLNLGIKSSCVLDRDFCRFLVCVIFYNRHFKIGVYDNRKRQTFSRQLFQGRLWKIWGMVC